MRLEIVAAIAMVFTILACVLGTNLEKKFLCEPFFDGNDVPVLRVVEVDASPSTCTSTGTLLDDEDGDFFFIVAEKRRILRDRSAVSVSTIA